MQCFRVGDVVEESRLCFSILRDEDWTSQDRLGFHMNLIDFTRITIFASTHRNKHNGGLMALGIHDHRWCLMYCKNSVLSKFGSPFRVISARMEGRSIDHTVLVRRRRDPCNPNPETFRDWPTSLQEDPHHLSPAIVTFLEELLKWFHNWIPTIFRDFPVFQQDHVPCFTKASESHGGPQFWGSAQP